MYRMAVGLIAGAAGGLLAAGVVLIIQAAILVATRCEFEYHAWAGIVNIACK
jgi:hypothetical protein